MLVSEPFFFLILPQRLSCVDYQNTDSLKLYILHGKWDQLSKVHAL